MKLIYFTAILLLTGLTTANAHTGDHSAVWAESGLTHLLYNHGLIVWFVVAALIALYSLFRKI